MKTINQFESDYQEAIDQYGESTVARVTREFWEENLNRLSEISEFNPLGEINIDDDWDDPDGYEIQTDIFYKDIYTISDLKEVVDRIVADGGGDLPVVTKDYEMKFYQPIYIAKIKPGFHPREDLYLAKNWGNAPKGEHVLIYDMILRYEESSD